VNVNCAGPSIVLVAPDVTENVRTVQNAILARDEKLQKREFAPV
jgi:hypothetical protein